jgi:hypothetical protein
MLAQALFLSSRVFGRELLGLIAGAQKVSTRSTKIPEEANCRELIRDSPFDRSCYANQESHENSSSHT